MIAKEVAKKSGREGTLDPKLMEEIHRALELMQRVRMANAEQAEKALRAIEGNTYALPEPLTLSTGNSA